MLSCDIILTVYNNLGLTQDCIQSVVRNFRKGDRLLIIDNGSAQPTRDYLRAFKDANPQIETQVYRFEDNVGYIKAVNKGLQNVNRLCACLLSNDTRVTPGWLDIMSTVMERESDIGIVNPMSTTFSLYPRNGQSIEDLAATLRPLGYAYREAASCVGFCMLIKRQVIEKCGFLEEIYAGGYFDDTDYSRKAVAVGFRCVIAQGAYVWHKEHSTFLGPEREALFKRNRDIFHQKWGKPLRLLCLVGEDSDPQVQISSCLDMARKGHWPWIVAPIKIKDKLKELEKHGSIKMFFVPRLVINIYAAYLVLVRRKKRFDSICLNSKPSVWFKLFLNIFYRGQIQARCS